MNYTTDYFNIICRISSAVGTTSRYEELLDLVVTSAVEAMDGKGASLFLADESSENFISVANTGLSDDYKHANPIHVKTVLSDIFKNDRSLCVKDATSDPRIPNHQAKKDEGIASLLAVPVVVKQNIIGVLTLYTATRRNFSKKEIALLKALAEHGGLAIERSKLIDGVLTFARLFKHISENINSTLDIKKILHTLTVDLSTALQIKGVLIRLRNDNTDELKLVASHGLSEEFLNKGAVYYNRGFSRVMDGESLLIEDVTTSDLIQYPKAIAKEGIVSILSVPVKTKDHVIGVMNLTAGIKTDFSKGVKEVAEAIAIQGGIAIQNASLYLKLHETKDSLEQDIWGYRSWF